MKKTFGLIIILMTLMAITVYGFTVTLQTPAASGTASGTIQILNASFDTDLTAASTWCDFYASSPSTNVTTATLIANNTNSTNYTARFINATFDSASLQDSNDYTFNATCFNGTTANSAGDTSINVVVENTAPSTPTALSPATNTVDPDCSVTFSATVSAANTTTCDLRFIGTNPGSTTYSITESGGTCSRTMTIAEATYIWSMRASDSTNTTDSAETRISCDKPEKGGAAAAVVIQKQLQQQNLGIAVSEGARTGDPQKTKEMAKAIGGGVAGIVVGAYVLPMIGIVGGPVGMMIGGIAGFILGSIA